VGVHDGGIVQASPAIDRDGTIYFGGEDKKVYAITPEGTKKWELVTGGRRNLPLSLLMGGSTSAASTTRFMQSDQGLDDLRS
jgi:outer membrane protein assembly factor BamB